MSEGAQFDDEVMLSSAEIGGQLFMNGSKFGGKLDMDSLQVDRSLFMSEGAQFRAEVVLRNAKIGDQLFMFGSKFGGTLNMVSLNVSNHLFMDDAKSEETINCRFAEIGGSLFINGSALNSLDLTGTHIDEGFVMSLGDSYTKWERDAKLTLRNTTVSTLQDHENAWPNEIDLVGFTYLRLRVFETGDGFLTARRSVEWMVDWLQKQYPYSPEPYKQLASVLKNEGSIGDSKEILYASMERLRRENNGWIWLKLTFDNAFIGYNYRPYRLVIWALFFTTIGSLLLKFFGEGPANNMLYVPFSFDMILPIIKLDNSHYEINLIDLGWVGYYFYGHKFLGYLLGSILIGLVSGVTKR